MRANHVKLGQLPHNHECAFSDVIKNAPSSQRGFCGLIVLERKMNFEKRSKPPRSLLLLAILYEMSLDRLHQTLRYMAAA